ncbi:hypothetical protein NQ317_005189 [Molorchus minor]|uniref:Uncharacterized protein n=1 Tax=Molorchus minor TaxID=1323400 RepID=A0ABQ9J3G3_9CUCU|nr:hypothetical protein NQ317_005189 [Molorchus minor]
MKFIAFLLLLAFFSSAYAASDTSNCKCWDGYEPKKDSDGVKCYGILLLHTLPCNTPERPKCECSGDVTGILSRFHWGLVLADEVCKASFLLLVTPLTNSAELSECKCHEGFEPRTVEDKVKCVGTYVTTTKACNIPERPRCKCLGSVSAILNDDGGTWCLEYAAGVELRRWPCENQKEWVRFYKEHPNEWP